MDEQNPRLNADRTIGRVEEDVRSYGDTDRPAVPGGSVRPTRPVTSTAAPRTAEPTGTGLDPETTARTREIRAEISHTRDELAETVNAIQDRLRPSNIASEAADSVKSAVRHAAHEVGNSDTVTYVRANPIPTMMVGIGLAGVAWLALAGRQDDGYRGRYGRDSRSWRSGPDYRSGYRDDDRRFAETGGGAYPYETAGEYTPGLAYGSSDATGGAWQRDATRDQSWNVRSQRPAYAASARSMTRSAQSGLRRTWDDNPLVIGAASLIVGAIVGLSVPETEQEHRLMGETRDAMVESVQETVRDTVTQVQRAATDAVSSVQNAAASAVGMQTGDGKDERGSNL